MGLVEVIVIFKLSGKKANYFISFLKKIPPGGGLPGSQDDPLSGGRT